MTLHEQQVYRMVAALREVPRQHWSYMVAQVLSVACDDIREMATISEHVAAWAKKAGSSPKAC